MTVKEASSYTYIKFFYESLDQYEFYVKWNTFE